MPLDVSAYEGESHKSRRRSQQIDIEQSQAEQDSVQVPFDRNAAEALVQQLQTESHQNSQLMVVQAVDSLNRAEAARSKVLNLLSDRKAYLTDPVMFWAELEQLTRQKQMKPAKEHQSSEAEMIELADSFNVALDVWSYPHIASASSMGALPAY